MTKQLTLELPDTIYELLEKADLLLPENSVMFYTAGLCHCMRTNQSLANHIHEHEVSIDNLYDLSWDTSMKAAEKALVIKNTDA